MTRGLVLAVLLMAAGAAPANAADPWRALHRPLHLPEYTPGTPCPVSTVDRRVDWEGANVFGGQGIGRGPVYAALGSDAEFVIARDGDGRVHDGWLGEKFFWYVTPAYRGRVLIRGQRLDARGGMRFGNEGLDRELHIRRGETVEWDGQPRGSRGVPSAVYVRASGCYAVQIDGTRFSRVVVFHARLV